MPAEATWYHAAQDSVSRAEGNSAVGLVAYITGTDLKDERTGKWCTRNHEGDVLAWGTVAPASAAAWMSDPECLGRTWNAVEASETRVNSRVAEHLNVAGKNGFTELQHIACAYEIADEISKRYSVLVTWGVHKPTDHGDDRNWHYHFGLNERKVEGETFGAKVRELSGRRDIVAAEITAIRKIVADITNKHLEQNGFDERVSHLSYKARGISKEPTRHRGHKANQLELKGERTEVGDHNREVENRNKERQEANERLLKIESEIVYIESKQRKRTMDAEELSTSGLREKQAENTVEIVKNYHRAEEYFSDLQAQKTMADLNEKELAEEQVRRQQPDQIDDAEARAQRAARYYDGSYESMLRVIGTEYDDYRRSQDRLKEQITAESDPDKRDILQLRHDIQHAEYEEIVHQRLAGQSYVITGKRGVIEAVDEDGNKVQTKTNHQIEVDAANYWGAKADVLRDQYAAMTQQPVSARAWNAAIDRSYERYATQSGEHPTDEGRQHFRERFGAEEPAETRPQAEQGPIYQPGVHARFNQTTGETEIVSGPVASEVRPAETRTGEASPLSPFEAHEAKFEQFKQTDEWREMSDAKREARQRLHDNYSEVLAAREVAKSNTMEEGPATDRAQARGGISF